MAKYGPLRIKFGRSEYRLQSRIVAAVHSLNGILFRRSRPMSKEIWRKPQFQRHRERARRQDQEVPVAQIQSLLLFATYKVDRRSYQTQSQSSNNLTRFHSVKYPAPKKNNSNLGQSNANVFLFSS